MKNGLPEVIFFDLDDTLISFSASIEACWEQVCVAFAPLTGGLSSLQLRQAIDEYSHWYWQDRERHRLGRQDLPQTRRDIVAVALRNLGVDNPLLADQIGNAYTETRTQAIWLLPGALDTLEHLRRQAVRLGLITNGTASEQRYKLARFELERFFDCILIEGEFGVGKPDERVYRHALKQMQVSPQDAWMVGDNLEWDVAGAQAMGLTGIWVDLLGKGLPEATPVQPNRTICSIAELKEG